jgi:hypothetical protein
LIAGLVRVRALSDPPRFSAVRRALAPCAEVEIHVGT